MIDFIGPLPLSDGKRHILTIIDRFSHYVLLSALQSTSTDLALAVFFHHWICRFGPPILVTSDQAFAPIFSELCNNLSIRHHLSAAYHPEGHGAVERCNREVQRILRFLYVHQRRWTDLVKPTEFILNTSYSRTLGVSPFEVLFGVRPRLPLRVILDMPTVFVDSSVEQGEDSVSPDSNVSLNIWEGGEPLVYSHYVLDVTSKLYPKIRDLQTKIYEEEVKLAKRNARGKTDFKTGDFVLIASPTTSSSLEFHWTGPAQVVGLESESMFLLKSIVDDTSSRVHVSRMFPYIAGELPDKDLQGMAAFPKLLCEEVLDHRLVDQQHYFFCKWQGVPLKDPREPDAWLSWAECRFCPLVREFCTRHGIRPRLHL